MSVPNQDGLHPSKEGPHWRNYFMIGESKGSNVHLECVFCGKGKDKPWLGNATRARQHLSGEGTSVKACARAPDHVRDLFRKADANTTVVPSSANVQRTLVGGTKPMLPLKRHEEARVAESRCIFFNGISFNVVDSDEWRDMIKAVGAAGPTYKPVSRNGLAGTELEKEVAVVNKSVKQILKSTKPYGYSVKSDGWTDVNKTYEPSLHIICYISRLQAQNGLVAREQRCAVP